MCVSVCVLDCNVILWQPHPIDVPPPSLSPHAQADADLLVWLWPLPSCAGGTSPSVLSFCLWIKQLPLSLFSHGSRRSVQVSTALIKAFQSACSQCSTSQGTVAVAGQPMSLAELSVVDLPVCCYSCYMCNLRLPVCLPVCQSISIQIGSHIDSLSVVASTMSSVGSGACTAARACGSCSHCF